MRTLRFFASIVLVLTPVAVAAQAKPTLAVLPFNYFSLTRGGDGKALGDAITDMILTEFAKQKNITLLERAVVEDLLTKQKLLVSGRVSDEDALRAGKLLGAQYVVLGSVVLDRTDARLDVRIADVETGAYPKPSFKERGKQDELLNLVERLVENFTADLKLPVRAVADAEAAIPVAASLAFSRGLDYEKRGKKQQAAQMYQKALELAPGHGEAKAALDRVR